MKQLTKEQALVIMGFTGVTTVDFGEFHEDVERRLGHPVMTHQFPALKDKIKEAYRENFMKLIPKGD